MSACHVTFTGAIRDAAKGLGRTATDDAVSRLNTMAQAIGEIDAETGTIAIRHAPDRTEPLQDWLQREVGRWPAPLPASTTPTAGSGFTGRTAAAAGLAARAGAQDDADAMAHAKALANGPNPFVPGGNRTHAAIIQHRLPELAAQLRQAKP